MRLGLEVLGGGSRPAMACDGGGRAAKHHGSDGAGRG
jgi:hypothetical protein